MKLKKANVAGYFYPENKEDIVKMFKNFEKQIKEEIYNFISEIKNLKALILPHAAYIYSGIVATYGYLLAKKLGFFDKVLLVGPSHYFYFNNFFQPNFDYYETPFGKIKVNKISLIPKNNEVFEKEHSLEVHLPFIQYFLKKDEIYLFLAGEVFDIDLLHKIHGKFDLIIVSSDLSHYFPYIEANKRDLNTISLILKKDLKNFVKEGDACGKEVIKSLIYLSKRENLKVKLLKYLNSGDTYGDKRRVVGYSAIAFYD